jgi:hypothetical protein
MPEVAVTSEQHINMPGDGPQKLAILLARPNSVMDDGDFECVL